MFEFHKTARSSGREEEEDSDGAASECNEDDGFEDDVQTLRNYSFLSVDTDQAFGMNALVQLASRKWLEANGQLEQWKQCYITNLSAEFPIGEHENCTHCQALSPHAKLAVTQRPREEGSSSEWASLLHNAAWYAWTKGNMTEAVILSKIAMEVRQKILGHEDEKTLSSMGMVSSVGWKEAEQPQVQVMETTKVLGKEHPYRMSSMSNLAFTWKSQGQIQRLSI